MLDTLAGKLGGAAQLLWLRAPADVLDGVTPIEAIVRHRIHAVLALAGSLPDAPSPADAPPAGSPPADAPPAGQ